jgi:hypothetical protein
VSVMGAKLLFVICVALILVGCAAVHQEDLQSWEGAPVSALDTHPVFLTMQVVRTVTADGTEIRNYVNGRNIASCSGGGSVFRGTVSSAAYNEFNTCMQAFAACNNIFYIKGGVVTAYTPIGTKGMRCYTNEALRPGFRGAVNIQ